MSKPLKPTYAILDQFLGSNDDLKRCIKAIIEISDDGALAPHGLGGHTRTLLCACYHRLKKGKK